MGLDFDTILQDEEQYSDQTEYLSKMKQVQIETTFGYLKRHVDECYIIRRNAAERCPDAKECVVVDMNVHGGTVRGAYDWIMRNAYEHKQSKILILVGEVFTRRITNHEKDDLCLLLSGKSDVAWNRIVLGGCPFPFNTRQLSTVSSMHGGSTMYDATAWSSYASIVNAPVIKAFATTDAATYNPNLSFDTLVSTHGKSFFLADNIYTKVEESFLDRLTTQYCTNFCNDPVDCIVNVALILVLVLLLLAALAMLAISIAQCF